jgi:hypothetical protein
MLQQTARGIWLLSLCSASRSRCSVCLRPHVASLQPDPLQRCFPSKHTWKQDSRAVEFIRTCSRRIRHSEFRIRYSGTFENDGGTQPSGIAGYPLSGSVIAGNPKWVAVPDHVAVCEQTRNQGHASLCPCHRMAREMAAVQRRHSLFVSSMDYRLT